MNQPSIQKKINATFQPTFTKTLDSDITRKKAIFRSLITTQVSSIFIFFIFMFMEISIANYYSMSFSLFCHFSTKVKTSVLSTFGLAAHA